MELLLSFTIHKMLSKWYYSVWVILDETSHWSVPDGPRFPPWCWAQQRYYQQLRFYFSLAPFPNPCSGTELTLCGTSFCFRDWLPSMGVRILSYDMECWVLTAADCLTVDCWLLVAGCFAGCQSRLASSYMWPSLITSLVVHFIYYYYYYWSNFKLLR
jgi:hypothetical protein